MLPIGHDAANHFIIHVLVMLSALMTKKQLHESKEFPLFVIGTTLYICMSALPFGYVFSLL